MRHHVLAGLVVFWLGPLALAAQDAGYDIRLQRPFKAGQSFAVSATNTQRTSQGARVPTAAGGPSQFMRRVLLDADVRIDKVDASGTQASVTIRKLELQTDNGDILAGRPAPEVLLSPGTELVMTCAGEQTSFARKNKEALSAAALTALQQALQKMAFTDTMYGTTEKRKVGDSWPINTAAVPVDRTNPLSVDPSQISGKVTLKAVRPIFGVESLLVEAVQTTKDLPVGGMAPKEATSTTTFTLALPVAPDRPLISYTVKVATHIVVTGQPQGTATLETTVDSELSHEATWTPK